MYTTVHDLGNCGRLVPFRLERTVGGLRLNGQASFVPDANEAGRLLLLAIAPQDSGIPVMVNVDSGVAGLAVTAQPVVDGTRRLAPITADDVEVDEASTPPPAQSPPATRRLIKPAI